MHGWRRLTWQQLFSVEVPESWTAREEDGQVALFDPARGWGALHISCARRAADDDDDEAELAFALAADHAAARDWQVDEKDIGLRTIGSWPAAELAVCDGGTFWHVWHVVSRRRVAYLSYNCSAPDRTAEATARARIAASFRWLDSLEN
ncbi:MAG TPA: hypothetical protein VKZ63_10860 [Kofleriaceae bacterium]|nr:hypothetical protein [Kofleriaceae bacterium]